MEYIENILVIDDDIQTRRLLDKTLSAQGFNLIKATTGKEGLNLAANKKPRLIILDLGLQDIDGYNILMKLREFYHNPIITLSFQNTEENIIKAFDFGANDFIAKPFHTGELSARIQVSMRHSFQIETDESVLTFNELSIDLTNHIARKGNKILKLTLIQFSLLTLFLQNIGKVMTHYYIIRQIWGSEYLEQKQNLRIFVAQLRKLIEDDPSNPKYLNTVSGIGYRFGD